MEVELPFLLANFLISLLLYQLCIFCMIKPIHEVAPLLLKCLLVLVGMQKNELVTSLFICVVLLGMGIQQ